MWPSGAIGLDSAMELLNESELSTSPIASSSVSSALATFDGNDCVWPSGATGRSDGASFTVPRLTLLIGAGTIA